MAWDWLEDVAAGASGVVNGLTLGAKPFDAWEGVRNKDLANDRSELQLRDLYQVQDARENPDLDYYGNQAGAANSGFLKTTAANNLDVFGNEQKLALAEYLSDPNGAFQQGVVQAGLTPGTPEYREWLAEAVSMYDAPGAVAGYDKMNIPGIQNRNLNEQAALTYIENYAKQKDPNAQVVRQSDGSVAILSNGELTPVQGDLLMKVASMIQAKTPYDAVSQGIKDEGAIQTVNSNMVKAQADLVRAMQTGQITPAAAAKMFQEQGVRLNQAYSGARQELLAITKSPEYSTATPEEKQEMTGVLVQRIQSIKQQMDSNQAILNKVVMGSALPRMTGEQTPTAPKVLPQGGASLTTRRPPGAMAARAAGGGPGAGGMPPWGASSQGPNYPQPIPPNFQELFGMP